MKQATTKQATADECEEGWVYEDGVILEPCRTCNPEGRFGEGPSNLYDDCLACHEGYEEEETSSMVFGVGTRLVACDTCNPQGRWGVAK